MAFRIIDLNLQEKKGIRIGDNILIACSKNNKYSIKIGIDAPKEINIARTELIKDEEKIKAFKKLLPRLGK